MQFPKNQIFGYHKERPETWKHMAQAQKESSNRSEKDRRARKKNLEISNFNWVVVTLLEACQKQFPWKNKARSLNKKIALYWIFRVTNTVFGGRCTYLAIDIEAKGQGDSVAQYVWSLIFEFCAFFFRYASLNWPSSPSRLCLQT